MRGHVMRLPGATLPILALILSLAALTPLAARADVAPLDAKAFEALTLGRTFFYTRQGQPFGTEQYLPDHKVIWAFTGDDCLKGTWVAQGDAICFSYEDAPDQTQCWYFNQTDAGLEGHFIGADPAEPPLIARQSSPEPMGCMGPDVGV